jgi:hypothetical protein
MKKYFVALLAAVLGLFTALPASTQTPSITNVGYGGITLITGAPATATVTSSAIRLTTFSGIGTLNITETGITGSPNACTLNLYYVQNNVVNSSTILAVSTAFTPSTGIQQFSITPTVAEGDQYVATYACTTYPTAGTINVTFSPALIVVTHTIGGDPCVNPNVVKSSVVISTSGAGTTQLVAVSAGKAIYVCNVAMGISATTATAAFESGGSTTCTSPTALTGTIVPTAGMWLTMGWGGTTFTAPAGSGLCLVNGGAGTQIGVLTYVQQ